jgi:hypothetical protein
VAGVVVEQQRAHPVKIAGLFEKELKIFYLRELGKTV